MSAVIEFTPDTTPSNSRSLKPILNINSKSGTFTLNPTASEMLGLNDKKNRIKLVFLEKEPEDWYVIIDPKGFELRPKGESTKISWITNSSYTAKKFFENLNLEGHSISCVVQEKAIKINNQSAHLLLVQRKA